MNEGYPRLEEEALERSRAHAVRRVSVRSLGRSKPGKVLLNAGLLDRTGPESPAAVEQEAEGSSPEAVRLMTHPIVGSMTQALTFVLDHRNFDAVRARRADRRRLRG